MKHHIQQLWIPMDRLDRDLGHLVVARARRWSEEQDRATLRLGC